MFDFLLVLTTLSAWGFGLWCYPKCIRLTIELYESNDPIIVDEAIATINGSSSSSIAVYEDVVLIDDSFCEYPLLHCHRNNNNFIPIAKLVDEGS